MTLFDTNSVGFPAGVTQDSTQGPAKPANPQDQQKLEKAAGEFESILLASMWKGMKQSFGTTDDESDPAHGTLDDWGIEIMSGAVGKAGGLGIGKLILKHLEPALESNRQASTPVSPSLSETK
jgi:Rod binding domain-containing protein